MALSDPSLSSTRSTEARVASKKALAMHVPQQPQVLQQPGGLWGDPGSLQHC